MRAIRDAAGARSPARAARLRRAAALAVALAATPLAVGESERVTIEGQAFDADGRPLAGLDVTIIEKGSGSPLDVLRRELAERVVIESETDAQGLFRVDLNLPSSRSGRVLVRCYDRASWDHLRYEPPADVDVTTDLRRRGHAIVTCAVDDAPVWRELVHRIESAGGTATARGKILRAHGMPPEVAATAEGTVEWRYPGVTYVFESGTLVRTLERDAREGAAVQAAR